MANSSDWLDALGGHRPPPPGWLALLEQPAAFNETLPFAAPAHTPAHAPAPQPDPVPAPVEASEAIYARGYADGEAAGRAAAWAEAEALSAHQRALRLAFRTLDDAARHALADDLAVTVMALCEGALAGAAVDRDALRARCVAAAERIGGAAAVLRLHLHPDDAALFADDEDEALAGWTLVPDPAVARGGLLIEGPEGTISDGPAEWRRAIAAAVRG